ncbi:ABC transporter ATP-binding protein [Prosthecomicrobium sp. N25]|uniref:ABC transporter ATP-binding protein n=1 Tax=Prosthecomicrobium sp. N25 TaxID=3129254 RepID=UPI003077E359
MTDPVLSAEAVVAGYVPGFPIVQGAGVAVAAGEIVTVIGPNGAGKSTLLKALAGLLAVEGGRILLGGRDVTHLPMHEKVAAGLAFVPQTGNVFTTLTIHENLVVGGHTVRGELRARLEEAYALFPDLVAKRAARAGSLSGGQRQMLAVARALMTRPRVVLLDEPTAGLAPRMVAQVFTDLRRLAGKGVAVLMVEQNAKAALRISDRGYVLAGGRNHASGRAADLLADRGLAEAFLGARAETAERSA